MSKEVKQPQVAEETIVIEIEDLDAVIGGAGEAQTVGSQATGLARPPRTIMCPW